MQSMQQSDEISLNSSPTIEKSSQGYKLQVWVLPEGESAMNSEFDSRYDNKDLDNDSRINTGTSGTGINSSKTGTDMNKSTKTGTDYDKSTKSGTEYDYNKGTKSGTDYNSGINKSGTGTSSGTSSSIGTTNPSGTTGSSGTTSTIGSSTTQPDKSMSKDNTINSQSSTGTMNQQGSTAENQNTNISRDDWRAQSNQIGQNTAMNDKSQVVVKVIDEKSGKEVDAKNIEMKVTTPSKKSFTTDLREKEDLHTGELALTEDGIYNIQTTIKTDDNKSIVIPFTYDNNLNGQSSMGESKDVIDDNR